MKSIYQDKWTRWHDRPCENEEPRSNNGWIYTAYAAHLMKGKNAFDFKMLQKCYSGCNRTIFSSNMKIDRSPGQIHPPISKDEIIGLSSLGMLNVQSLINSHWNFCNLDEYEKEPLTIKKAWIAVKSLWKIRKEHRNHLWQNQMTETYCLAFRLMPWDTYYIKKDWGFETSIFEWFCFYLNFVVAMLNGSKSSRMLMWLRLKDLGGHKLLLKILNEKKAVETYFGKEHDFYKAVNGE